MRKANLNLTNSSPPPHLKMSTDLNPPSAFTKWVAIKFLVFPAFTGYFSPYHSQLIPSDTPWLFSRIIPKPSMPPHLCSSWSKNRRKSIVNRTLEKNRYGLRFTDFFPLKILKNLFTKYVKKCIHFRYHLTSELDICNIILTLDFSVRHTW